MTGNDKRTDWDSVDFDKLTWSRKRDRLLKEANQCCSSCGFNARRQCGGSILEIDHIDGDHKNNEKKNLQVLCPNCHALTPNFRNWGRKRSEKSSTRIRKGNKDYEEYIEPIKIAAETRHKEIEVWFVDRQKRVEQKKQSDNEALQHILNSEIDFSKFGFINEVSKIIGITPQRTRRWLRRMAPHLLKNANLRRVSSVSRAEPL